MAQSWFRNMHAFKSSERLYIQNFCRYTYFAAAYTRTIQPYYIILYTVAYTRCEIAGDKALRSYLYTSTYVLPTRYLNIIYTYTVCIIIIIIVVVVVPATLNKLYRSIHIETAVADLCNVFNYQY